MRTLTAATIALGVLLSGPALATTDDAAQTHDAKNNAALWYWRAITLMSECACDESFSEAIRELTTDPTGPLPEELVECVQSKPWILDQVFRAVNAPVCAFAVDDEHGVEAAYTHLRGLRDCGVLLCVDARLKLEAGNAAAGAKSLAACIQVAIHLGETGVPIGSLAAKQVLELTDGFIAHALAADQLDPTDRETIERALREIDISDPLGFATCIDGERRLFLPWARREFLGEDGAMRFAQYMFIRDDEDGDPSRERVEQLFPPGKMARSLDHYDATVDDLVAAFADSDLKRGHARLNEIMTSIDKTSLASDHLVAGLFIPNVTKIHNAYVETRTMIESRLRTLEESAPTAPTPDPPP